MKKFWAYFFVSVLIIAVAFVLVSLVMSSVHGVTLLAEWQSWFPDTAVEVEETTEAVVRMIA